MWLFYDFLIFGWLIGCGIAIARLATVIPNLIRDLFSAKDKPKLLKSYKTLPAILFFTIMLIGFIVVFWGSFIEPRMLVVNEYNVKLDRARPQTIIRAAVAADFHFGPYKKTGYAEKMAAKINALKPDIVFLLGDFLYDDKSQIKFLAPLGKIRAPLGVFAVLGNHDYGERDFGIRKNEEASARAVRSGLESLGIRVLVNQGARATAANGAPFTILGVDEYWTWRASIEKAEQSLGRAPNATQHTPTILLSHNPDMIFAAERAKIDLMISAHTHGGQIRMPVMGSVPEIPYELGRDYDKGLFRLDNINFFITSGAGEVGARARLFNPPEIAVLNITL